MSRLAARLGRIERTTGAGKAPVIVIVDLHRNSADAVEAYEAEHGPCPPGSVRVVVCAAELPQARQ